MKNLVAKLIEFKKEYPNDFSQFWNSMNKQNRLRIWHNLSIDTQKQVLLDPEILKSAQRQRLWDNIGIEQRIDIWDEITEEETFALVDYMTPHQQVTMFMNFKSANFSAEQKQMQMYSILEQ